MSYLLDTNACITHLKSSPPSPVTQKLGRLEPQSVLLCSVVKAELVYGALRSRDPAESLARLERFFSTFQSAAFDDEAAIARKNDYVLVTHNTSEFGRVRGLRTEDWEQ